MRSFSSAMGILLSASLGLTACTSALTPPRLTSIPTSIPVIMETPTAPVESPVPVKQPSPTPAALPTLDRSLGLATPPMQGDDVRQLQDRLLAYGYQPGSADGIFGPQTVAEVRRFQLLNKLDLDGVVGPQTWAVLFGEQVVPALLPQGSWAVLVSGGAYIQGGFANGQWLDPPLAATLVDGPQSFQRYQVDGGWEIPSGLLIAAGPLEGQGVQQECANAEPELLSATLEAEPAGPWLALASGWEPQPRPVVTGDPADPALQSAVAELLRREGLANPVVALAQVLRVDLVGDGRSAWLFSATHGDEGSPQPAGSYSIIGIWYPGASASLLTGKVIKEPGQWLDRVWLTGLLDLNGDSGFELITRVSAGIVGGGTTIYTLSDDNASVALEQFFDDGAGPCVR